MPRRRRVRLYLNRPGHDIGEIGRKARDVLCEARAVLGGSEETDRLHNAYNDLARSAGFAGLQGKKNPIELAKACRHLAIEIRSGSWAIGRIEAPSLLPKGVAVGADAPRAEVEAAREALVACGAEGWAAGALQIALGHVLSQQSIPAFLYGGLMDDVARGIQNDRQQALARILGDIQNLGPEIPSSGPPNRTFPGVGAFPR